MIKTRRMFPEHRHYRGSDPLQWPCMHVLEGTDLCVAWWHTVYSLDIHRSMKFHCIICSKLWSGQALVIWPFDPLVTLTFGATIRLVMIITSMKFYLFMFTISGSKVIVWTIISLSDLTFDPCSDLDLGGTSTDL